MEISVLRNILHDYISTAIEEELLTINMLIEEDISSDAIMYDKETLDILNQRREEYLSGKSKTYTAEESIALIRALKK